MQIYASCRMQTAGLYVKFSISCLFGPGYQGTLGADRLDFLCCNT
ncbi:MAG: hypothetical protein R3C12_07040 [Planctomycetaceae bacterium]